MTERLYVIRSTSDSGRSATIFDPGMPREQLIERWVTAICTYSRRTKEHGPVVLAAAQARAKAGLTVRIGRFTYTLEEVTHD